EAAGPDDAQGALAGRGDRRRRRRRRAGGGDRRRAPQGRRLMFLVVFRNRKRAAIDQAAYDAEAEQMQLLAARQPGYLGFKSYHADDGEAVSISEWQDEASAL